MDELKERLDLIIPGGIGDIAWAYSKLCNIVDDYDVHLKIPMPGESDRDLRSQPFLNYLPGITPHLYASRKDAYISLNAEAPETFKEVVDLNRKFGEVYCGPNKILGEGIRIENYLYDLKFKPNFLLDVPPEELSQGDNIIKDIKSTNKKLITIFASTVQGIELWNLWSPEEWLDFILRIHTNRPEKFVYAIVGAKWDVFTAEIIEHYFDGSEISCVNLAGKTKLGEAFKVIQQSDLFVSYNSGLAVLSSYWNVPTIMLYPKFLTNLQWSWVRYDSIIKKSYVPFVCPRVSETIPEALRLLDGEM